MAQVVVVGHFLGAVRDDVLVRLGEVVERGGAVRALVAEEDLPVLAAAGFVFHRVDGGALSDVDVALAAPARDRVLGALATPVELPASDIGAVPATASVAVLTTVELPPAGWVAELGRAGVEVLERVGNDRFLVRGDPWRWADVAGLPFVIRFRLWSILDVTDPATIGVGALAGVEPIAFDVRVHRDADRDQLRGWLLARGLPEIGTGRRKVRFLARVGDPLLVEMAELTHVVAALDRCEQPELLNDHALRVLGATDPDSSAAIDRLDGTGQVVGVADSGVDGDHPDFAGRIVAEIDRGRAGDRDPNGHGTHVAGSMAGSGKVCARYRGMAPGASIVVQALLDRSGGLGGLPVDLYELFDEAYDLGVRIHNNSWGAYAASVYSMSAREADEFVAEHPDMLLVVAAGNRGIGGDGRRGPRGEVDRYSIDAPATAKNVLTVGASRSSRPLDGSTWGEWWPTLFPDPPIADDTISGDPECLAAFSGRGPCQDANRVKPDVVAPGTAIVSARSRRALSTSFWSDHDEHYAVMGGTSMAAPFVAGAAAVIRQGFELRGHEASAALLKATIINGTRRLLGRDATVEPGEPNNHQGFGLVDLAGSLPDERTAFVDTSADRGAGPVREFGEVHRFRVQVGPDRPLRICLCWTDPPGRGVQHALGVELWRPGSPEHWTGNHRRHGDVDVLDTANNVQIVRPSGRLDGIVVIDVRAVSDLIWGPQHFALVVAGDVRSDLARWS